jgi:hypothetical protein
MFVVVGILAFVCAAFARQSLFLTSIAITATLAVALGATIATWRFPIGRSFYGPMALVVWAYLLILFYEPLRGLSRYLITSHIVFRLWGFLAPPRGAVSKNEDAWLYWQDAFYSETTRLRSDYLNFQWLDVFYYTSNCISAVFFGLLAGWITVSFERRRATKM